MRLFKTAATLVLLLFLERAAGCATILIYTDPYSWRYDVLRQDGRVVVEPFLPRGLSLGGLSVLSTVGHIAATGGWVDQLDTTQTTTFMYPGRAMFAFGGMWDLAGPEGGLGPGISVTLNVSGGEPLVVPQQIPPGLNNSFWGLIYIAWSGRSFGTFGSFTLNVGSSCGVGCVSDSQSYRLSNLQLGVPEPSTMATITLALGILMAWSWIGRQKRLCATARGFAVGFGKPRHHKPAHTGKTP